MQRLFPVANSIVPGEKAVWVLIRKTILLLVRVNKYTGGGGMVVVHDAAVYGNEPRRAINLKTKFLIARYTNYSYRYYTNYY